MDSYYFYISGMQSWINCIKWFMKISNWPIHVCICLSIHELHNKCLWTHYSMPEWEERWHLHMYPCPILSPCLGLPDRITILNLVLLIHWLLNQYVHLSVYLCILCISVHLHTVLSDPTPSQVSVHHHSSPVRPVLPPPPPFPPVVSILYSLC